MGRIFFRHLCLPNDVFLCAKNNFSSHLVTMAIGSANPVSPMAGPDNPLGTKF